MLGVRSWRIVHSVVLLLPEARGQDRVAQTAGSNSEEDDVAAIGIRPKFQIVQQKQDSSVSRTGAFPPSGVTRRATSIAAGKLSHQAAGRYIKKRKCSSTAHAATRSSKVSAWLLPPGLIRSSRLSRSRTPMGPSAVSSVAVLPKASLTLLAGLASVTAALQSRGWASGVLFASSKVVGATPADSECERISSPGQPPSKPFGLAFLSD
jgi:hypothetical protein